MLLRQKSIAEWVTSEPLTSGEARIVELGNVNSGIYNMSDRGHLFITFSVISSHTCLFEIRGFFDPAAIDVPYFVAVPAATLFTPYDMPAPYNMTGYLTLVKPVVNVRLSDTATANHTYTRLYVKAWG